MNRKLLLSAFLMFAITFGFSQTKEELEAQKAEKQAEADKFQAEANALQAQIDALPGWRTGAFGTIGGSIGGFDNWFTQASPNNSTGSIGFTVNAFANKIEDKYFWRNALNVNLGWVKFDDKDDPTDDENFKVGTDVFNITSLYGYKLSEKFAVSTLAEYRTALLEGAFNDPGYLDIGVGATWTPIENLVVVFHPLNYNFVFSSGDAVFESSLGCKVVADYTRKIGAVSFKTNFSGFLSYEDTDYSNWQWTNGFSYTLWKKIGVGFDFGLRGNKQEAYNYVLAQSGLTSDDISLNDFDDNEIQSFWLLGLSYAF